MIIKNQAQCLVCGDVVESKTRWDFKMCTCGNLAVDGGLDYAKRSAKYPDKYREMSIHEKDKQS